MARSVSSLRVTVIEEKKQAKRKEVLIDGKPIVERIKALVDETTGSRQSWSTKDLCVQADELVKSATQSGEYAIFNCCCGHGAMCAGMADTVEVLYHDDLIIWKTTWTLPDFPLPLELTFYKSQYQKELGRLPKAPPAPDL